MTLQEIRQGLLRGGAVGDKAIVAALKTYPEIGVKAHNEYGDGAITAFRLSKEDNLPHVSFYSLGDGTDRDSGTTLGRFISGADSYGGYAFSWREERLRYTHTVTTTFGRECLDEAYRQAAEWLSDENIAIRKADERATRLVTEPYRRQMRDRYPRWEDMWKYQNACRAVAEACRRHYAVLGTLDDAAFTKALKTVYLRNERHDEDFDKGADGEPVYDVAIAVAPAKPQWTNPEPTLF